MTIVVAGVKGNSIAMGCDTLTTLNGDYMMRGCDHQAEKIKQIGSNIIGMCGGVASCQLIFHYFEDVFLSHQEGYYPKNSKEAWLMYQAMRERLFKDSEFLADRNGDGWWNPSIGREILWASPSGLYFLSTDGAVYEIYTHVAIGSGSHYALGAMHAYSNMTPDDDEEHWLCSMLYEGVSAACHFSPHCSVGDDRMDKNVKYLCLELEK